MVMVVADARMMKSRVPRITVEVPGKPVAHHGDSLEQQRGDKTNDDKPAVTVPNNAAAALLPSSPGFWSSLGVEGMCDCIICACLDLMITLTYVTFHRQC